MNVRKSRLILIPLVPIIGAFARHYAPDWIAPEVWWISSMLSILCLAITFVPWEEL